MTSLYDQLNAIANKKELGFALITGQRAGGKLVAQTPNGSTIMLNGTLETGKSCYYDRYSLDVTGEAPNGTYAEYGV